MANTNKICSSCGGKVNISKSRQARHDQMVKKGEMWRARGFAEAFIPDPIDDICGKCDSQERRGLRSEVK